MTNDSNSKDKTDVPGSALSVTDVSWAIFSIGFLCSLLIIGYDAVTWLKTGVWPNLPFYLVFNWVNIDPFSPVLSIEWKGIKKILLWSLKLPLSLMSTVLGAVLAGLFYSIFTPAAKIARTLTHDASAGSAGHREESMKKK